MLYIKSFTFNPFSENTYIVYNDNKECAIIDPGMFNDYENNLLLQYIRDNQLKPTAIINTHAHIDHVLGINFIKREFNIPFYLHDEDDIILANAKNSATMFGFSLDEIPVKDGSLSDGQVFKIGDDVLKIQLTPGHSPGSVTFYHSEGKWAIVGDVLFNRSIGRTDLPGGDFEILKSSIINVLYQLPDDTKIYSGHGDSTFISEEKQHNPFVRL